MRIDNWDPNRDYVELDIVRLGKSLFMAKRDNKGILPYTTIRLNNTVSSINNSPILTKLKELYGNVLLNNGEWIRL